MRVPVVSLGKGVRVRNKEGAPKGHVFYGNQHTGRDPMQRFLSHTKLIPLPGRGNRFKKHRIWTGCVCRWGTPQFGIGGKVVSGHRWIWSQYHGPLSDAIVVRARCGNRRCVDIGCLYRARSRVGKSAGSKRWIVHQPQPQLVKPLARSASLTLFVVKVFAGMR